MKLPLSVKPPLAVVPPVKHGVAVLKFRFVTDTELSLFWESVVEKAKLGEPLLPVSVAVQLPFTLLEFIPPLPQLPVVKTSGITSIVAICFM